MAHRRNVASLNLFYRYYIGRCSSELAQLVPLTYSRGRSTRFSDRLRDFSVTISRCLQGCLFQQLLSSHSYNPDHNILRLFDVLPNFLFTTSEIERDY